MYIRTCILPEDWNDETKYPDKQLIESIPEKGYIPNNEEENTDFIFEKWQFDGTPNEPYGKKLATHITLARCPKCGGYHINQTPFFHNTNPDTLEGSAGIRYHCPDCGYYKNHIYVKS